MYFWKVDELVEDFKADKVTQKEELKYMLFIVVIITLAVSPYLYVRVSYNLYDFITTIVMIVLSVWGVYYCYKINSSGDNEKFIVRATCIGTPILIRVFVVFLLLCILVQIIKLIFPGEITGNELNTWTYETTVYEVVYTALFLVSYYVYLGRKIKAVAA